MHFVLLRNLNYFYSKFVCHCECIFLLIELVLRKDFLQCTGQTEQRFKTNLGKSLFACWWSEKFLFVFNFWDRIASLWKYPVDDVDLKILFYQGQQVSLRHLGGYLCYQCGEMKPAKVLN